MKILLVTSTLRPVSGWGTHSRITAEGLAARGHDVHVLCAEASDAALPQRIVLPDPSRLLRSPMALLKTAVALKKAIKEVRPDVVHFLAEPYVLACPSGMPPWVMNLHGTYAALPFIKPLVRPLADRAFRFLSGHG